MPDAQREIAFWKDLLTKIAEELEHAAGTETDAKRKAWFTSRAMRIRQRLHEGMPEDFTPASGHQRMNRRR